MRAVRRGAGAFLRALAGLRRVAGAIGEHDEEQRCSDFLRQLDPDWDRVESEALRNESAS